MKPNMIAMFFLLMLFLFACGRAHPDGLYVFGEVDAFQESWERTAQGGWHYDTGPKVGLRLEVDFPVALVYAEAALNAAPHEKDFSQGLGFSLVGQRTRVGFTLGDDDFFVEGVYQLKSWFPSGRGCGPNWMVGGQGHSHSLMVRVTTRVL